MLGVFKRRWKPKRSANVSRVPGTNETTAPGSTLETNDSNREKPPSCRPTSNNRQVHPLNDDKAPQYIGNGYSTGEEKHPPAAITPVLPAGGDVISLGGGNSPPPYLKRASLDSNLGSPTSALCYPLAPNICVEAGRIQFIKQETEGALSPTQQDKSGSQVLPLTPPLSTRLCPAGRVTVTRGQQTECDSMSTRDAAQFDEVTKSLEHRIQELEIAVDAAQKNEIRDKQTIAKLQKQIARRESAQRDADRERRLRADSESRAKQALQEAARCRSRLKLLTNEFARMEETVRSMLVYKKQVEQLRQEKNALTLAFENRCQQYQTTITRLNSEVSSLRQQLAHINHHENIAAIAASPEEILQAHATALQRHAEESRKQYERCLDDVANQVVRALLAQKGLREEVGSLNNRIHELESQNSALTSMLVHQLRVTSSNSDLLTTPCCTEPAEETTTTAVPLSKYSSASSASEEGSNPSANNLLLLPSCTTPSELLSIHNSSSNSSNFKHCNSFNSEVLLLQPEENFCCEESNRNATTAAAPSSNGVPTTVDCNESVVVSKVDRRLSANSDVLDTRLSLEDKKRHQVLTKLWTELKGSEVTPKKLLEALSAVDSALWVPPQRPVSLNLQLPILQATKYRRTRPVLAHHHHQNLNTSISTCSKSEEETTTGGNESPESSGNRDEGYSTMSSDVQTELTRGSSSTGCGGHSDTSVNTSSVPLATAAIASRGLEDLKEATDETAEFTSANNTTAAESETTATTTTRLLLTDNNNKDPDILYIPFNLLNLKPRNSYPPGKDMLPFQHIMRSFSDSHLCIKITAAPSPCYTFSSPISSSPSIFLLDITEKNPLRRAKATSTLWGYGSPEYCDEKNTAQHQHQSSWSSPAEDRLECTAWDAEYIQQWLRLDETRSALQQQHRDLLELEYDRAELEDWSLSLSNDDLLLRGDQYNKRMESSAAVLTPGQISISTTLPSIQENNTLELEEDANECLWNNSSYMMDKEGRELVTLLMDNSNGQGGEKSWPYAMLNNHQQQNHHQQQHTHTHHNHQQNHHQHNHQHHHQNGMMLMNQQQAVSPENSSWSSSGGSDCCNSHEPETCSKRSSAALSGCSDDTGELPAIGTDFTRDFYRLVKFESTKSLASTSSRSLGGALSDNGDHREATLHNVLTFIAEQQKYVASREHKDCTINTRPCSVNDITKEFNIEGPPQRLGDLKICDSDLCLNNSDARHQFGGKDMDENYVTLKQLCQEYNLNEQNKEHNRSNEEIKQNIAYANEVCLVTPLDVESENCSNIGEHPVDICSSINVELTSTEYQNGMIFGEEQQQQGDLLSSTTTSATVNQKIVHVDDDHHPPSNPIYSGNDLTESISDTTCSNSDLSTSITNSFLGTTSSSSTTNNSESSLTASSLSTTPETVISKIPRRKHNTNSASSSTSSKRISSSALVTRKLGNAGETTATTTSSSSSGVVVVNYSSQDQQPKVLQQQQEINNGTNNGTKIPTKSKIPHKSQQQQQQEQQQNVNSSSGSSGSNNRTSGAKTKTVQQQQHHHQKQKIVHVKQKKKTIEPQHVITSERLPPPPSGGVLISNIIDGPPHRAVSFHERATSKDVIDELNRMIRRNGDEAVTSTSAATTATPVDSASLPNPEQHHHHHEQLHPSEMGSSGSIIDGSSNSCAARLDQGCKPTGWVHVERDIDLTDPKARANLLDVMMASVSSDSSPTSSCGGSVASDTTEDPPDYGHLHRIHRFHRQKKANAVRPDMAAVVRAVPGQLGALPARPTIIGRPDFFVRYGEKEMEAVASFDFLDEFSSGTGSSISCSIDDNLQMIEEVEETVANGGDRAGSEDSLAGQQQHLHLKVTQV